MVKNGQKRSTTVNNCQQWSKTVKHGKMVKKKGVTIIIHGKKKKVKSGQKHAKTVQNSEKKHPKWSKRSIRYKKVNMANGHNR